MITATLFMDVSGAIRSLNEFGSKVQGLSNLSSVFRGLKESFASVTEGIAAQFEKLHSAMHLGAELEELSAATGQSVRDLVVLRKAFSLAGMAGDEVGPMIAKLQTALGGMNEQGEPTAKVFERIGLSVNQLKAQGAIQQIRSLQAALAQIHDPSERMKAMREIFGKGGFRMGGLLTSPKTMDTAEKKAGGFGSEMENAAPILKKMEIAVGELGDRWKKFYANLLVQIAPALEKFFDMMNAVNFSAAGKQVGNLIAGLAGFVSNLNALLGKIPLLHGGLGQLAIGFIALKTLGPVAGAALKSALDGIGVACIRAGGMVGALRFTWNAAWTSMAAVFRGAMLSIKTTIAATGIGLLVVALMEAAGWAYKKIQKLMDSGKSSKAADADTGKTVKEYGEKFEKLASEDERAALREQIQQERKLAEEEAKAAEEGDDPKATALRRRVDAYDQLLQKLADVPKELIDENAELKRQEIAAKEAEKAVEELRKTVAKLADEYDKLRAKNALEALPLDERRGTILKSFGPDMNERGVERGIEIFRNAETPEDAAHLEKLVEAYKEILEINKKRVEAAERATEAETQHEEKIQQLGAELAGNEALLRTLKAEAQLRERIAQLRAAGVQNPVEKAQQEIGMQTKLDDQKRGEKTLEWKKKFALEMRKLDAQVRGDKAAERAAEREEKIESYAKDAVGAGLDKETARKAAILRVDQEDAAKAAEDAKKTSVFADSDRRIGLGGIAVQTRADPLVKAQQDATRATNSLSKVMGDVAKLLQKQPNTIMKPLVPLFQ